MKLIDLEPIVVDAYKKWAAIKNDLQEHSDILDKAYLVMCNLSSQATLMKVYPFLNIHELGSAKNILTTKTYKRYLELQTLKPKNNPVITDYIPLEDIAINAEFSIEVRFSELKSATLRAIKDSPLSDKEINCMCDACIRIRVL